MALPDYNKQEAGAAVTWKTAADGSPTYSMTFAGLLTNAAREGPKHDLGADWDQDYVILFKAAVNASATTGNEIELWFGQSPSGTAGTDNPSNLTGVDAALSNPDQLKFQSTFACSLILANARTTSPQIVTGAIFRPKMRYIIPFIVNLSGQTLHTTGAGNFEIRLIPVSSFIKD